MEALKNLATFTTSVAGVSFTMRRRSTVLMLEVGDVRRVFGLIAGSNTAADRDPAEAQAEATEEYAKMQRRVCEVALVAIDGQPVDPEAVAGLWDAGQLPPVGDALFRAFMGSSLDVDPTPDSCEGQQESS